MRERRADFILKQGHSIAIASDEEQIGSHVTPGINLSSIRINRGSIRYQEVFRDDRGVRRHHVGNDRTAWLPFSCKEGDKRPIDSPKLMTQAQYSAELDLTARNAA